MAQILYQKKKKKWLKYPYQKKKEMAQTRFKGRSINNQKSVIDD